MSGPQPAPVSRLAPPPPREHAGVVLRPYRPGDETRINAVFNRVFSLDRELDEWRWKCEGHEWAIAVAEVAGEVVAHAAGIPSRLVLDDRVVDALQVVDTFSLAGHLRRPEWRDLWVATMAYLAEDLGRSRGVGLMYGLPGRRARRQAVARCGYDAVPAQPVTVLSRAPAGGRASVSRYAFRAELVEPGDPRLDQLWAAAVGRHPVAFVHDAAFAARRLADHPAARYARFVVCPRLSSRPAAFVAFRLDPDAVRWVDLVWDGRHAGALELAAHLSARLAATHGAAREELWLTADPEAEAVLARAGFSAGPEPRGIACILRALDPTLDLGPLDGRLRLTMADADLV